MARIGRGIPNRPTFVRSSLVDPPVSGTLADTEANDALAAAGATLDAGTLAVTEANDTLAASAGGATSGTLAATEAADSLAGSGSGVNPATLAVSEASDSLAATATAPLVGTVAVTEAADSLVAGSGDIVYDDFTGSAVDPLKWIVYNRLGDQVNAEVNAVIPANARVSSGNLLIDSKFETVTAGDTTTGAPNPRSVNYTSAQLSQRAGSFLYGSVRVRAKLPGGTGLWPCIWMLGTEWQASQPFTANVAGANWPNGGWWEIDIAEFLQGHRTVVNNALHFITASRTGSGEKSLPFDATTRFMVYRLDWAPTSLTWMVDAEDGVGWRTLTTMTGVAGTDIPNTPGYLIIHTAVGGTQGGTPDSATFPQTMSVDYAQVQRTANTVDQPQGFVYETEGNDSLASAGSSTDSGTVAVTEASDSLAAVGGATTDAGTLGVTEAADTLASAGTSANTGTEASTEANDTLASSGAPIISGTFADTESADGLAGAGTAPLVGTLAVTEANDTLAAAGAGVANSGTVAVTEASDSLASAGTSTDTGTFASTENNDTVTSAGSTLNAGTLADTEGNDTAAGAGTLTYAGFLAAIEAADMLAATGHGPVTVGTAAFGPAHLNRHNDAGLARHNDAKELAR